MNARTTAVLAVLAGLAAPIVAFGGGFGDFPTGLWLGTEAAWALPLHPDRLSLFELLEQESPPPRPEWCNLDGSVGYTPTTTECTDFDDTLDTWLIAFLNTTDANTLASAGDPPSYCGGC